MFEDCLFFLPAHAVWRCAPFYATLLSLHACDLVSVLDSVFPRLIGIRVRCGTKIISTFFCSWKLSFAFLRRWPFQKLVIIFGCSGHGTVGVVWFKFHANTMDHWFEFRNHELYELIHISSSLGVFLFSSILWRSTRSSSARLLMCSACHHAQNLGQRGFLIWGGWG